VHFRKGRQAAHPFEGQFPLFSSQLSLCFSPPPTFLSSASPVCQGVHAVKFMWSDGRCELPMGLERSRGRKSILVHFEPRKYVGWQPFWLFLWKPKCTSDVPEAKAASDRSIRYVRGPTDTMRRSRHV